MKKIFFLFLCTTFLFATPSWFHNHQQKDYALIGYGADEKLSTARDIAKAEISKQISLTISSDTTVNKSINNDTYNKSVKNNIATTSNATLQGITILKEENKDGLWYVAVLYDNRTLLQKIQEKHPTFKEKDVTDLDSIKLIRKNNSWYLQVQNDLYFLNEDDFLKLFSTKTSRTDPKSYPTLKDGFQNQGTDALASAKYSFKTNKLIYNSNDELFFEITSKEKGFISILYSEQNGKVGIILENQPITNKLTYPNPKSEEKLYMFNPTKKTLQELYICIFSPTPINLKEFEAISENPLDESNYNFHKLLDTIKDKKYATIKLKIKGEK